LAAAGGAGTHGKLSGQPYRDLFHMSILLQGRHFPLIFYKVTLSLDNRKEGKKGLDNRA
jgi:hypothetical protein